MLSDEEDGDRQEPVKISGPFLAESIRLSIHRGTMARSELGWVTTKFFAALQTRIVECYRPMALTSPHQVIRRWKAAVAYGSLPYLPTYVI